MHLLIIDFYDSFIFNVVHYFEALGAKVTVMEDNEIDTSQLNFLDEYQGIVLSPGPGLPTETHSMMSVLNYACGRIPVFGICLGMQGIALAEGGNLFNLVKVRHGKKVLITKIQDSLLLQNLPERIEVGLYHSWGVQGLPAALVCALDENGVPMVFENPAAMRYAVQFHPESVMTPLGREILSNVLNKIFSNFIPK